jgi:predicted transposase/invertase (TIGR01784 family)
MTTPRPHDALFKATMEDPARAADLLRLVLPTEILAHADLASLAVEPGSFVDDELADEHTDLLLSLPYRGRPALVYVLVEHKSTLDAWVFVQMLEYMSAVWQRDRASDPDAPPRPILPILVSHAEGGWAGPARFVDHFGSILRDAPELRAFVPDFAIVHEDLRRRDDATLREAALHPGVVMTLLALRDARRGELLATLRNFMEELRALAELRHTLKLFRQLVRYIVQVVPELPAGEFRVILLEALEGEEDALPTLAEQWLDEGRAEGRAEGRSEALRKMLRTLLRSKFGDLDAGHEHRIDDASTDDLERCVERFVAAQSIDDVLARD